MIRSIQRKYLKHKETLIYNTGTLNTNKTKPNHRKNVAAKEYTVFRYCNCNNYISIYTYAHYNFKQSQYCYSDYANENSILTQKYIFKFQPQGKVYLIIGYFTLNKKTSFQGT